MGKVTLFHPVALTVLRGALAYNGFTVGKFSQLRFDPEKGTAVYTVPLIMWDKTPNHYSIDEILRALKGCFASDVDVTAVWVTPSGSYMARVETSTRQVNFLNQVEA